MHERSLVRHCLEIMLAGAICLLSAGALAAKPVPCVESVHKFCKQTLPAKWYVGACLRRHEKELPPACKAKLDKANADTDIVNFIDLIPGVDSAQKADVFIIPAAWPIDYIPQNPRNLGCTYVTHDPSRIARLIAILRNANLRMVGANEYAPGGASGKRYS